MKNSKALNEKVFIKTIRLDSQILCTDLSNEEARKSPNRQKRLLFTQARGSAAVNGNKT